jgi:hypothetical protein
VFNALPNALVCLNMLHTGYVEPNGHCGCSSGQSGHFDWSHITYHMKTQSFENIQKSVFFHILDADLSMKG